MSLENVEKFYAKLGEDKGLLERVTKAGEGLQNRLRAKEEMGEKVMAEAYWVLEPFAREIQCPFTQDELQDYVMRAKQRLSEEQLDAIAGGQCACVVGGGGANYDGSTGWGGCAVFGIGGWQVQAGPSHNATLLCFGIGASNA